MGVESSYNDDAVAGQSRSWAEICQAKAGRCGILFVVRPFNVVHCAARRHE